MKHEHAGFSAGGALSENIYYGEQIRRAKENFHTTGLQISLEPKLIMALGYVKKAAALAKNKTLHEVVAQEQKLVAQEKWDEIFSFDSLIKPKLIRK